MLYHKNDVMKNLSRTFKDKILIKKKYDIIENGRKKEITEDYFTCWCNPKDLYGRDLYEAINTKFKNTLNFEVRYCDKIKLLRNEMISKKARFSVIFDKCEYEIYYVDFKNNSKDIVIIKSDGIS